MLAQPEGGEWLSVLTDDNRLAWIASDPDLVEISGEIRDTDVGQWLWP